jgi:predicted nucleotidyltransferase
MEKVDPSRAASKDDSVLNVIVDRLIQIYRPERIYLFGSAARGDAGPDSDYDFMILVSDASTPELRDPGAGYRALWRLGIALDLLVWTRSQFESRLHLRASLPATILREGKLVYAA